MSESLESIRVIYYISTANGKNEPEKITGPGRAQGLLTEKGVFLGERTEVIDNGSTIKLTLF